jgi:protein-tyrosine phosphatase
MWDGNSLEPSRCAVGLVSWHHWRGCLTAEPAREANSAPPVVRQNRCLEWEGCYNVRDLGGLRTAGGRETRWGAIVRSEAPHSLTADGWSALHDHGIRTIIDLRNDDEIKPDVAPRPAGLPILRLPLDAADDAEFWDRWAVRLPLGTPLYYRPFLGRFPHRIVRVLGAIAHARPGGVLVHCAQGRDRTGLITLLLLALVGATVEDIAADYVLSTHRLSPLFNRLGQEDPGPAIDDFLIREGTSAREVIISTLASLDVDAYVRAAGLRDGDLAALRARLLSNVE